MIRYVGIAVGIAVPLVLFIITVTDWSSTVKVLGRESKQQQQQHCDVDDSVPCRPACPTGWLNYEGKCYFFSEEEKNWTSSQSFCASHGSSLAVIETEAEKAFIMHYGCSIDYWIGLQKEPDQTWKWIDGTELNDMLEVKGEGGDCVFLNSDSAVSSRCHRIRNWVCSHPDIYTKKRRYSATK
ncbi:PREDICTED: C-type lectin domain family 2 member B-like [Gekko japonicus]|uniref:C-type lectin domain family 2 member B-like n=1 Tax=Gekko japonicus TaxID=146911 RepID=A0ABM1K4B0_GEKJA|nr:PREDICTED: C-type lectin domain family 2 member B-like [Gekko japonicus]XP_015268547.1 PREDICTED: C-type lectin domain family 2 member B-like [Gekko japonicus]